MLPRSLVRFFSRAQPDDPAPLPHAAGGGLALALTGGGARAAYQAGVMRGVARRFPDFRPRILTGVSAGALNGAFLGIHAARSFPEAAEELVSIWRELRAGDVFRLDRPSVVGSLARIVRRPAEVVPPAEGGFLDTSPLQAFVERHLGPLGAPVEAIGDAIRDGHLGGFALTTSSYSTGQSVTWVEGEGLEPWDRPMRRAIRTRIRPEHVLASSALPFFFPAVRVDEADFGTGWYGDGGIRLTAPLSPALHLGADKIFAIHTRYNPSARDAERKEVPAYPPSSRVLGVLMNAVFLDVLDRDAQTLRRINALLAHIPPAQWGGFRPVDLLVIRPSVDLARLASGYEPQLPPSMRTFLNSVASGEDRSPDWLSMLLFEPDYLNRLIELGEADAEARTQEIADFLGQEPAASDGPLALQADGEPTERRNG
jgi:NTE family protein